MGSMVRFSSPFLYFKVVDQRCSKGICYEVVNNISPLRLKHVNLLVASSMCFKIKPILSNIFYAMNVYFMVCVV